MPINWKEFIICISYAISVLIISSGIFQVLCALAEILPKVITGIFFTILQVVVLSLSILALVVLGFILIKVMLGIIAKFEDGFTKQIQSIRRQINKLTNNLASEILAIVTACLIAVVQEQLSNSEIQKYSIGIMSSIYLFFSVQLIKSEKGMDKWIGIFFYLFPLLIAIAYFLPNIHSYSHFFSQLNAQSLGFLVSSAITLLLAFYYALKSQETLND